MNFPERCRPGKIRVIGPKTELNRRLNQCRLNTGTLTGQTGDLVGLKVIGKVREGYCIYLLRIIAFVPSKIGEIKSMF